MKLKSKGLRMILGLILILALVSLGCGLSETLGTRLASSAVETTPVPTRTPWPTFTVTAESVVAVPIELAGNQVTPPGNALPSPTPVPTDTPLPPPPTDTPSPVPPTPTDTPAPAPTKAPAPPPPTPTNPPAPPPKPQYQFTPGPWYGGDRNDAIVRFYGHLKDSGGNAVNGYSVKASCGNTTVLSFPSGPSFVAPDWAPGWYDIVFPNPVSCNFTLQVVEYQCDTPGGFDAQCKQYNPLSEAVAVTTNVAAGETVVVADWIKNW